MDFAIIIIGLILKEYWRNHLNRKLNNPKENLPFMLCWANENWTRVWDGGESNILLKQEYSEEDDYNHITRIDYIF